MPPCRTNIKRVKCLVTGSAGFIGSHLGHTLQDLGHDVLGLDDFSSPTVKKTKFETIEGSVMQAKWVDDFVKDTDLVFHLAALINVDESIITPLKAVETNFLGTMNVLEAVKKHNKRMIFASSSEIYGSGKMPYMREDHILKPRSAYGASKAAADRMCYAYWKMYGTRVMILRNFNTFGEGQRDDSYGGVIAKFCKAGSEGKDLEVYGDGNQTRDYMHVTDAVDAYLKLASLVDGDLGADNAYWGEAFNAGTGREIMVNTIAHKIAEHYKVKIKHVDPRPGEVYRLCAGTTKIKSIGWHPQTVFEYKLDEYIKWYDSNN